jgi:hypothetical protein
MDDKELAEKSAPVRAVVPVAGKSFTRPPVTVLTLATALKKKKAKLAREGQSRQGMLEANGEGNQLPVAGSHGSSPGAP